MRNKQKIFLVTQGYPYNDGEKTFIEPELHCLVERDVFDITLISNTSHVNQQKVELPNQIKHICIKNTSVLSSPFKLVKYVIKYFIMREIKEERKELYTNKKCVGKMRDSLLFYIRAQFFWESVCKTEVELKNSIVYTYWNNIETLAFALHKADIENMKLISRIHRYDLYDESTVYGRQPFRKIIDYKLDRLIFIAKAGMDYYTEKMGKSPRYVLHRLGTINENYSCETEGQKDRNDFLLVSCSYLIPVKRVNIIIDALAEINDFNIRWVHFGDGVNRYQIQEKAEKSLSNKKNIQYMFLGKTSNEEIMEFYEKNRVDSFISTSQSEGCPVSIQEALSYGIPIIGTAVGEIPLMIDGNGVLVSANPSAGEVADAIRRICFSTNKELMRVRSREIWENNFDARKNHNAFCDELLQL